MPSKIINVLKKLNKHNDEYYTPPEAIAPLLKYLDKTKIY